MVFLLGVLRFTLLQVRLVADAHYIEPTVTGDSKAAGKANRTGRYNAALKLPKEVASTILAARKLVYGRAC